MTPALPRVLVLGVTLAASAGCVHEVTTSAPSDAASGAPGGAGPHGADAPLVPVVTPTYASGEPLSARIPALDGSFVEVGQLVGRVVVVAFIDPTTPALAEHLRRHHDATGSNGAVLVLVAMQGTTPLDFDGLEGWLGRADVFVGWDPQGALATKLRIESLPTTLVLARDGRVIAELDGAELDGAELDGADSRGLVEAIARAGTASSATAAAGESRR